MPHDQAYPEAEKKIEEARHSLEVKETMKKLLAFTLLMLILTACAPAAKTSPTISASAAAIPPAYVTPAPSTTAPTPTAPAPTVEVTPTVAPTTAATEAPTIVPTPTAINLENLQPGVSVPMDIKSSKGSEIVTGNFSSHVVNGSLHGGIPVFQQKDDPYGAPNMIPVYIYFQDGVTGPYFQEAQRSGEMMAANLTGVLLTQIGKRYVADNNTKLSPDTWPTILDLMKQGNLPLHFTTSEGDFTYYPSPTHGYKVFYVPWESADPAKDPRFIEVTGSAKLRLMTTLDEQGNLVFVMAANKPLDQIKTRDFMEFSFTGLARVINNADQSLEYLRNHQMYNGIATQLGDWAINTSAPSIQLSDTP